MRDTPKYPDIEVVLVGEDGNAFSVMGRVIRGLKDKGVSPEEISKFINEATSGDYDNVIQTAIKWVNVT